LVSTDKLLQKFIDREISVEQNHGENVETFSGTLLSTSGGLVLREADGSVRMMPVIPASSCQICLVV